VKRRTEVKKCLIVVRWWYRVVSRTQQRFKSAEEFRRVWVVYASIM